MHGRGLWAQACLLSANPASSIARRIKSSWSSLSRIVKLDLKAEQVGRAPEQPISDVVKRARPDPRCLFADQRAQALHHLAGRAASKCDQHDRPGRNPACDQMGDAVGDHSRFSRPGPSQNQVVSARRGHRGALRLIQLVRQVMAQAIVQGGLKNNLPHATAPAAEQTMEVPSDL